MRACFQTCFFVFVLAYHRTRKRRFDIDFKEGKPMNETAEMNTEQNAAAQEADTAAEMGADVEAMSDAEFEEYLAGEYGAGDGEDYGDGYGSGVSDYNGQTTEPSGAQERAEEAEDEGGKQPQAVGQAFKTFETQAEWQSEIDRIIGDRLKNTHKTIDEYEGLKRTLSDYYNTTDTGEALRLFREDIESQMAEREGVDLDMYRRVQNTEQENAQYKRQLEELNAARREEELNAQARAIQTDWEGQAEALKKAVPDFDLRANMQNSEFADYVVNKRLSIADAYYLTRRAEQMTKNNQKQARRAVHENGAMQRSSGGSTYTDINKMSDADFEKYLERHM